MTTLPAPRTPDPMAAPALNWGVLGTGWIAERFVDSVQRHTRQRFTAVASRDAARAQEFAARHEIRRGYGSYEELVAAADVDVVYVATEHTAHLACARLVLEAYKHVLVEKPLGLNAAQGAEIAELAASRGLFCAEALWTFFLPRFDVVRQVLDSGMLGQVRSVLADLGEYFDPAGDIASCVPISPVGHCSISVPTRCRWPPGCWAPRRTCRLRGRHTPRG